jgi:hypothetical protein
MNANKKRTKEISPHGGSRCWYDVDGALLERKEKEWVDVNARVLTCGGYRTLGSEIREENADHQCRVPPFVLFFSEKPN